MPITGNLYDFTDENISASPAVPGVYALYYGNGECVYIGSATVSIKSRLQVHKRGDEGRCTQVSSHYKREPHDDPLGRERYLLREYYQQHSSLPRCNTVMP